VKKFLSAVLSAVLVFFVAVSMMPAASAAASYTVTFSAGDKGTLTDALYNRYAASYSVTRTASGNIKIVVPAGSNMPDVPTAADVNLGSNAAKYYVSSGWEPTQAEVTQNVTYVVSYGAIVNGVEYTVRYVDAATGNDVASPVIAIGNVGDTMSSTAKTISGYTYDGYNKSMVLTADAASNVLTFNYSVNAPANTGTTTTTTVITTTTTTAGGTGGAAATNPAATTPAGTADNGQNTAINDNNVPLANNGEEETVENNETPTSTWTENTAANTWTIVGGVTGAVLLGVLIFFAVKKRAKER